MNFNQIQNLIVKEKGTSVFVDLIIDYKNLKTELMNASEKSWYFKRGIPAKRKELKDIYNRFENHRLFFNESSVDDLLREIQKKNKSLSRFTKEGRNLITVTISQLTQQRIDFLNEMIRLKSKMDQMETIDYYMKNPDGFMKFLD